MERLRPAALLKILMERPVWRAMPNPGLVAGRGASIS
jgi:hypothetical protein